MSMIGNIREFNGCFDDWNCYAEILEQYFEVNEVPENKRVALLISVVGSDTYKSLRDLCHPVLPKEKSFAELCELLRKQFSPQVAIFRERTVFYKAKQNKHETVTNWYARLKKLSVDCKFGETLEKVLVDKFVTGLRSGQILDRLCEENETLSLETAIELAVNKECALKEYFIEDEAPPGIAICPMYDPPQISNCPPIAPPVPESVNNDEVDGQGSGRRRNKRGGRRRHRNPNAANGDCGEDNCVPEEE